MVQKSSILVGAVLISLGVAVVLKPEIIAWILGIYLILSGVLHMFKSGFK